MSLSRVKTWIAGETLSATDLNAEFNNILVNPSSLISDLIATQANQETGSALDRLVTSGRQHFHLTAPKGLCNHDATGATGISFNCTVTDNGTGDFTVVWGTDFSGTDYCVQLSIKKFAALTAVVRDAGQLAGSLNYNVVDIAGTPTDPIFGYIAAWGDQA